MYTGQNPRRLVVSVKTSQRRTICTLIGGNPEAEVMVIIFAGPETPEIYFLTRCEHVQHYSVDQVFTSMLKKNATIKEKLGRYI